MADRRTAIALYLLIVLPLAPGAAAQDRQGLEKDLQTNYVGKYWIIRGFYGGGNLVFDTDGRLSRGEAPESWTLAGVEITDLRLHEADVEIQGKRVGYLYDPKKSAFIHKYRGIYSDKPPQVETVKITLQIPASAREGTIRQAIESALIAENQDLSPEVPGYWRGYVDFTNGANGARLLDKPDWKIRGPFYYSLGKDMTPPHPLSTPDPDYPAAARKAKIEGIAVVFLVVDKSGGATEVRVKRPVGFGLDDQAVETVRHWTFQPAERNGEPVAVIMHVEVSFRLN